MQKEITTLQTQWIEENSMDWIAELVAATGRFEKLCDHATEWAENFCEKNEK